VILLLQKLGEPVVVAGVGLCETKDLSRVQRTRPLNLQQPVGGPHREKEGQCSHFAVATGEGVSLIPLLKPELPETTVRRSEDLNELKTTILCCYLESGISNGPVQRQTAIGTICCDTLSGGAPVQQRQCLDDHLGKSRAASSRCVSESQ
jgi:hypothetical protein